jgi:type I restriction enzyme S subunit
MSIEKNVSEIRFEGFSGEWVQSNLAKCTDLLTGNPFNSKEFTAEGIFLVRGMNVKRGYLDTSPEISEFWPSYKGLESYLLKPEDIVIQMDGALIGRSYAKIKSINLPAILVQRVTRVRCNEVNPEFIYQYIQKDFLNHIFGIKTETAVPHLSLHDIRDFSIFLPKRLEQNAIGNYFQKLDTLINQHQQKHDKLSNIKKAMLEKMFPKQGETIPEIRFKGFSGEWEVEPFGVCFANIPNNTLSRANLNYENGMAKNIHYGDILIKFGEVLDATNELLPFITNDEVANKLQHAALRDGDIIIADAAEDSMVGKCTELFNIDGLLVLSGLHTIAVRPTLSFASKYLGYYLNSSSYHDQLLSLMQGTKVLSISKTAIQNTNVAFPKNAEEQAAIGNYFHKLDALINQHQQQITKLNNIKQACLSKMFV